MMAIARCPMEWCEFAGINSIDVGMSIKKRPNLVQPAVSRSIKESLIKISLRRHDREDPQRLNEENLEGRTEAERRSSSESARGERAMRLRCCVADRRKETDKANPLLLLMLASLLSKPSIALSILPTTQREQREREALMTSIQEHWRCSCLESSRAYRSSREMRQRSMKPPAEEEAAVLLLFLSLFFFSSPSLLLLDASRRPPASPTIDRSASPH